MNHPSTVNDFSTIPLDEVGDILISYEIPPHGKGLSSLKVRFHNPVFYYFIVQKLLLITRLYATYVIADEEHEEIIKSVLL
ncbi:5789_t:CDS:2 [Rhizophagus irregularis]|nr:5789_t:CDS:2 [Rhizophagus irregularis]